MSVLNPQSWKYAECDGQGYVGAVRQTKSVGVGSSRSSKPSKFDQTNRQTNKASPESSKGSFSP